MMPLLRQSEGWVGTSDVAIFPLNDKNDKNEIKKQVIYLYVCYPPGLVDGRPDKEHQKKSTIPLVILPRLRGRAHRF